MENEEIKQVVSQVAPHLYGFKAQDQYLVHDFGYKLLFYSSWNDKSEVIGQDCTYSHRIGCSFKKDPKKIAADIKRRLLKNYKEDFIKRKKQTAEAKELKERKISLLKALAQESGGNLREDYGGWRSGDHNLVIDGDSFTIKQKDNFFKFSLTLDFGESLKIIQFLKDRGIILDAPSTITIDSES